MTLSPALQALTRAFVAACVGTQDDVKAALAAARAAGTTSLAIDEALLLVVAYAGVPRAILAFGAWRDIEKTPTSAAAIADHRAAGEATFAAVYGERAERIRGELRSLHPELHDAVLDDAYGRILARTALPAIDRELLAVAVLVALKAPRQTSAHAIGARRAGASGDAVKEAATLASPFATSDEIAAAQRRFDP